MVEVLRVVYCLPFLSTPPLSTAPIPLPSYSPTSIKGAALEEVTLGLVVKGAVELAPLPSPGFYSRLFVVWKTSGSWRPVIDLSPSQSLCGRVSLSDGDHSVCAPVGSSGGLDGLHRSERSVSSSAGSPSFSSLSFASCSETKSTSSKRSALASPRLRRSSPGSWLLFPQCSILWGSV